MSLVYSLSAFEGPLDLLLFLIGKAKIDILQIFVSQITEQYLDSLLDIDDLDMDTASEFLEMAATLLEIKSRSLLPKPPKLEVGEESPEDVLLRRLTVYAALKEGVTSLQTREMEAAQYLAKLPEELPVPPPTFELYNLTLDRLMAAFAKVLARVRATGQALPPPQVMEREKITLESMMFRITAQLSKKRLRFEALFEDAPTRHEIVTAFVALLELLRLGRVQVTQNDAFDALWITSRSS